MIQYADVSERGKNWWENKTQKAESSNSKVVNASDVAFLCVDKGNKCKYD